MTREVYCSESSILICPSLDMRGIAHEDAKIDDETQRIDAWAVRANNILF